MFAFVRISSLHPGGDQRSLYAYHSLQRKWATVEVFSRLVKHLEATCASHGQCPHTLATKGLVRVHQKFCPQRHRHHIASVIHADFATILPKRPWATPHSHHQTRLYRQLFVSYKHRHNGLPRPRQRCWLDHAEQLGADSLIHRWVRRPLSTTKLVPHHLSTRTSSQHHDEINIGPC